MNAFRRYFQKFFQIKMPHMKIRQEAYQQVTRSLNLAFNLPSLKTYAATLSTKGLLKKAVEMFVGSRVIPKNIGLSRYLLNVATSRSLSSKEKDEIQYYKYFFIRIDAFKTGQKQEFDMTTQVLNNLAIKSQHPQSCYLVGKQIINIAMNTYDQKQKKKMFELAANFFQKSLNENNYGGLYYLGDIFKNQSYSVMKSEQYIQFFQYGAALGDPLCYFKLSQLYFQKKEKKLYLYYLKLAAESGVIEAQHNLGCEYLSGQLIQKNEIKALAWFTHAGAHGYIQSKYNIFKMFLQGSSCGRVAKNPKVALVKLQELKEVGVSVDQKIEQDIKKILVEKQKNQAKT